MAIINKLPHPGRPADGSAVLPFVIVKDDVLLQPNDYNGMGLELHDQDTAASLVSASSNSNCGWLRVPVDVTDYNTLTVVCSGKSAYKANQYPVVSVDPWTVYESGGSFQRLGTIGYLATSSSRVTRRTVAVDISALTGIMFISFTLGVNPAAFNIHDLYLS